MSASSTSSSLSSSVKSFTIKLISGDSRNFSWTIQVPKCGPVSNIINAIAMMGNFPSDFGDSNWKLVSEGRLLDPNACLNEVVPSNIDVIHLLKDHSTSGCPTISSSSSSSSSSSPTPSFLSKYEMETSSVDLYDYLKINADDLIKRRDPRFAGSCNAHRKNPKAKHQYRCDPGYGVSPDTIQHVKFSCICETCQIPAVTITETNFSLFSVASPSATLDGVCYGACAEKEGLDTVPCKIKIITTCYGDRVDDLNSTLEPYRVGVRCEGEARLVPGIFFLHEDRNAVCIDDFEQHDPYVRYLGCNVGLREHEQGHCFSIAALERRFLQLKISDFVKNQFNPELFGAYLLKCPIFGCSGVASVRIAQAIDPDLWWKVNQFLTIAHFELQGQRVCMQCDTVFVPEKLEMICQGCAAKSVELSPKEEIIKIIADNAYRACPNPYCNAAGVRVGGCNCMKCPNDKCGMNWCYICHSLIVTDADRKAQRCPNKCVSHMTQFMGTMANIYAIPGASHAFSQTIKFHLYLVRKELLALRKRAPEKFDMLWYNVLRDNERKMTFYDGEGFKICINLTNLPLGDGENEHILPSSYRPVTSQI